MTATDPLEGVRGLQRLLKLGDLPENHEAWDTLKNTLEWQLELLSEPSPENIVAVCCDLLNARCRVLDVRQASLGYMPPGYVPPLKDLVALFQDIRRDIVRTHGVLLAKGKLTGKKNLWHRALRMAERLERLIYAMQPKEVA